MVNAITVFAAGGLGCVIRYLLTLLLVGKISTANTILLVNLVGSFCAGLAINFAPKHTLLIAVGFLGGFTTFSAFSLEAIKLLSINPVKTLIYIVLSAFGCVIAAWCGSVLSTLILKYL
jgi:CrcB protein